jgi:two-component system, cell cycle sensor histidine kinase and response regulator CckA
MDERASRTAMGQRIEERVRRITDIQARLLSPGTLSQKLSIITDGVVSIFDADFARIWLSRPGDRCQAGCMHAAVAEGPHACPSHARCLHLMASSGRYTRLDGEKYGRVPFGCYKIGRMASGVEPSYLINDIERDPQIDDPAWAAELGLAAAAGCRLSLANGESLGVLALFSRRRITAEEHALLTSFSHLAVPMIQEVLAEAALRESETFLAEVGRIAQIGGWEMDLIAGTSRWTRAMYEILGMARTDAPPPREELELRCAAEDRQKAVEAMRRLVDDEVPMELEARVDAGERGIRWFKVLGRAVRDNGRCVKLWGTIQDITDRKDLDQELRSALVKYRTLFDSFPLGITVGDRNGKIVEANRIAGDLLGISLEEHLRRSLGGPEWRIIRPDGAPMPREEYASLRALREDRIVDNVEMGVVKPSGEVSWLNVTAAPVALADIGVVVTYGDVGARVKAEAALQESEGRLRLFIEHAPVALAMFDKDMRYLAASHRWMSDYGLGGADILGRSHYEVFPEITDEWKRFHRRALGGEVVKADADRFERADGAVQYLRWELRPWRASAGGVGGIVIFTEDITERVSLESQLRQAQKMESIGRLAGGVAHDFNNLLTAIMGHTEACRRACPAGTEALSHLDAILDAARRSASITRQLLAFARKQAIAPVVLDLNEHVTGTLALLRRLIGEDIELAWLPNARSARVKMDPSQVDQVLANLAANARDAIAGVGKLTIETADASLDAAYCAEHAEAAVGDYVMLAVSDTGCGMDRETAAHAFEPFYTTKPMGKGTGLGLATIYGIVKQNQGHVNVYSEPGKGTTFRIYLRRHEAAVTAAAAPPVGAPSLPRGSETVLVVEDESSVREVTALFLKDLGYSVLSAGNPEEAFRVAAEHGRPIQLLVTDVVMPGMNGRELAVRLSAAHPRMQCLYVSGYTENVIAHHGILDEGVSFLAKPFTQEEIARKIRQILAAVVP